MDERTRRLARQAYTDKLDKANEAEYDTATPLTAKLVARVVALGAAYTCQIMGMPGFKEQTDIQEQSVSILVERIETDLARAQIDAASDCPNCGPRLPGDGPQHAVERTG